MLNIGDAVLTFLGDTSQLDQVFARLPAQAEASMAAAASSVGQVGTATQGLNFELDATAQNVPYCGEVIKETMESSSKVTREARGEAGLLGEAFGIHLPRHVRSFIAELPGVGTALSGAFAATAIFFIIEALAKGVEKVIEFAQSGERVEKAMEAWDEAQRKTLNGLEDGVLHAQVRLDELSGNHLEALRLKLQSIDNQNLDKLDAALQKLGQDADKVFAELHRNWLSQAFLDLPGSDEAKDKLQELGKTVSKTLQSRDPEAYAKALKELQTEFDDSTKRLAGFDEQLQKHEKAVEIVKKGIGPSGDIIPAPDPNQVKAWELVGKSIRGYIADLQDAQKQANLEKAAEGKSEAAKQAEEQVAAEKRLLDQRMAALDQERAKSKLAFDQGKIDAAQWAAAENKAVTDTIKEHEKYGETVVQIYKRAGEAAKAHAAEMARDLQLSKDQTKVVNDLDKATVDLAKANAEFDKTSVKIFDDLGKGAKEYLTEVQIMERTNPFKPWQKDILLLNNELKALGVQGLQPMEQKLDSARKAEALLNAQGVHEGKLWLQVQAAKLKAIIAIDQAGGKSATREIRDLQNIERELLKFDKAVKSDANAMLQFKDTMKGALDSMSTGFQTAIQAWISGEKSLGQALADSAKEAMAALSAKAAQEALWDAAKGLVALATGDGAAAGQYFAAAEIMGLIAVTSGFGAKALGGGGSKGASGGGGGSNNATIDKTATANKPAGQPTATVNMPHLASGAIVTKPTQVVVGDQDGGGSQVEGVFPLGDARAFQAVQRLFGGSGGGTQNHYYFPGFRFTTADKSKLTRQLTRDVQTGRARVVASKSPRRS